MRQIRKNDKCEWPDCEAKATELASDKESDAPVRKYCRTHGNMAINAHGGEYSANCPNCGCGFGVN